MDINFADSFLKSLKRLMWHESRVYKFYDFFRRDIGRFVKNVWRFRKALANHYWWDHHGTLMFLETGLTHMSDNLEVKGMEVDGPRMKKVAASSDRRGEEATLPRLPNVARTDTW